MHARLDQLLSLRDGAPVDAQVRAHVQQCSGCLAELTRVTHLRERLRSLPAIEPPSDAWATIQSRADAQPSRKLAIGAAAAFAALAIGALTFIAARDERIAQQPIATVENQTDDQLGRLIAQSRELEAMLDALPERPQVERVSTAATVDSIEERIQWLDWQLVYGTDAGLDRDQAQRLWSERVDLMDSLVKVRYAEAAPMVF